MAKRALVTGITGQDGAYLAKLLLEKGYEVYGAYRRSASGQFDRLRELGIDRDVRRVPLDLLEAGNIVRVIEKVRPDELYNLAAQSFVAMSFELPTYTGDVDALGVVRLLEAIRMTGAPTRLYQASSSEMFGKTTTETQNEDTPFHPRSPYAAAKLFAHWMTVTYRESYGMYCASGILFNHESPLRGIEFVTRKITASLARIRLGKMDSFELGDIDTRRDWGFAGDYVLGMWQMLQPEGPADYVLATGESHSVREFVAAAARAAGFELEFVGEGADLRGVDLYTGRTIMRTNLDLFRPGEVYYLRGDSAKAQRELGWRPTVSFDELAAMMIEADLDRVRRGVLRM